MRRHRKGTEALSVAMLSRQPSSDQRERVLSKRSRRTSPAIAGFSLIEVLFAVLILTMGMIFVAMQFPVGLANSRKQTEATIKIINTHNAKVMMELQLAPLKGTDFIGGALGSTYLVNDGSVHFLYKPNVRVENFDMVMDDPFDGYFDPEPSVNYDYATNVWNPLNLLPPHFTTTIDYSPTGLLSPRNLGFVVSPPVGESDQEMQDYGLPAPTNPNFEQELDNAVFDVALNQRGYSWLALYQSIGNNNFRFIIFTIRSNNKNKRFAVQDQTKLPLLDTLGANEDRMFPVPWLIKLNDPLDTSLFSVGDPIDRFDIFDYTANVDTANTILNMLQEGTKIVDAIYGHIYEVMEVNRSNANWNIRLTTDLHELNGEYLEHFWLVPPAIEDSSSLPLLFGEVNPVVDVAEQVIRF